jgi:predicted ATPase
VQDRLQSTRFEVLRKLGSGGMGVVYEALDHETRAHVAIKTLRSFDAEMLLRLKHEFRELADIQHPNLMRFGELYCEQGQWFFTMELVHGQNFLSYVRLPYDLDDGPTMQVTALTGDNNDHDLPRYVGSEPRYDEARLRAAARQLATAIHALHRAGRVHRDLKPSNVLVRDDGHVVLLDFGLIEKIGPRGATTSTLYGTPHFVAPEQIEGGMVGPEADWYAFGVMLFVALTGALPFTGPPPVVVDAKRKHRAPPPREIVPDAPADLDELCQLLLQLEPSARPSGEEVLRRLEADDAAIAALMGPSAGEAPSAFVGRGAELAELADSYRRARAGARELIIVQGEPGVGKSTLVRRFLESQVALDGNAVILAGRCYEQESVPFKAFDTVIDSLSTYLAKLDETTLQAVLARGFDYLASVFPVLRRVPTVGEHMSAERVASDNAIGLRARAFGELRQLLAAIGERVPLVLFIDDLQWADKDSLELLAAVFGGTDAPRGLVISTLRITSTHDPTSSFAPALAAVPFRYVDLHGLAPEAARSLWATLWAAGSDSEALPPDPGPLLDEAAGHPLFLSELVRHARVAPHQPWRRVHLLDALGQRFAALDEAARRFMELVALAGTPIPYQVIAEAAELELGQFLHLVGDLRTTQMIRVTRRGAERLVEPYHDRIREAIVRNLRQHDDAASARLQRLHLRLGRRLLHHASEAELGAQVFSIVNHLNAALELIDGESERGKLADLNLLAARQAKLATAYETAQSHLAMTERLLPQDAWRVDHDRMFSVQQERVRIAYLLGHVDEAVQLFDAALEHARNETEWAALYTTRIEMETARKRFGEAIATARQGLRRFGVKLPEKAGMMHILRELAVVRLRQGRRSIGDLAEMRGSQNEPMRCAMQMLIAVGLATYYSDAVLMSVVALKMTSLTLAHGATAYSSYGFIGYAIVMSGGFGELAKGFELGELGLRLDERFGTGDLVAKIYFLSGLLLTAWVRPAEEAVTRLRHAYDAGLRFGDLTYRMLAATGAAAAMELCGSIEELVQITALAQEAARRQRDLDLMTTGDLRARTFANFATPREHPTCLAADPTSDEQLRAGLSDQETPMALVAYCLFKTILCQMFGEYQEAWRHSLTLEARADRLFGTPWLAVKALSQVLTACHLVRERVAPDERLARRTIRRELGKLRKWARACPRNFEPWHLLAFAEAAGTSGRAAEAVAGYATAIAAARVSGVVRIEALAHEQWSAHARRSGDRAAATLHLREAIGAYERWGARGKAEQLRQRFGEPGAP